MEQASLKPNRTVFITYSLAVSTAITTLIAVALLIGAAFVPDDVSILRYVLWGAAAFVGIGTVIGIVGRGIQYRKRRYTLTKRSIRIDGGGIFSDSSTEVELRNVTHVKLDLPWPENRFFKTGNIRIESAGSGGTEAHLDKIDDPERVYSLVLAMLKENGFSLSSKKTLYETEASKLGAAIDVVAGIGLTFFLFLGFAPGFVLLLFTPFALLIVPVIAFVGIGAYLTYRNAVSKRYTITEDAIHYDEGFLTKRRAVIPAENLSDSHVTEPLHKRIFGIADVRVSCQGSGSEIRFSNIANAKEFDATIDTLSERSIEKPETSDEPSHDEKKVATPTRKAGLHRGGMREERTYKPTMRKHWISIGIVVGALVALGVIATLIAAFTGVWGILAAFGFVPFLLFFGAFGFVSQLIVTAQTTYTLEPGRIKHDVNVFSRQTRTFTDERLTQVSVKRSLFDRLAKTMTIEFSSIGSGDLISFSNLGIETGALETIRTAYGLYVPESSKHRPNPRIGIVLRSMLVSSTILAIVALALLALGIISPLIPAIGVSIIAAILGLMILSAKLTYRNAMLSVNEQLVYERHGWLGRYENWADIEDVKGFTITRYPFGREGTIRFNVAGERVIKTKDSQTVQSNHIDVPYLSDVLEVADELSNAIDEFAQPSPVRIETGVSVAQTVVPLIVIGTILLPFAPIIYTIAIISGMRASRKRYMLEDSRIIKHIRFLYETKTILFGDRIDHISSSRGFLNRMFSTGNTHVNTTGSSRVEMTIGPTKDHDRIREELRRMYAS